MISIRAFKVRVEGKVQGVGFRASTANFARQLPDVTGFVQNLDDGSVEVFVQGPEDQVEALMDFLQDGPPTAVVSAIKCEPTSELADLQHFSIR